MGLNFSQNEHEIKIKAYSTAIEKYNNIPWYTQIELLFSIIVITLQIVSTVILIRQYNTTDIYLIIATVIAAYVLTDFINGLVHMIIDNNSHYTSIVGPFIAAFHLHHFQLAYQYNNAFKVYFYESGHKIWLVFYLILLVITQASLNLNFCLNLCLVSIGILSSVAELSHFWCHNKKSTNRFIKFLQKYHILLSMQHHKHHHQRDNTHYAFLNGASDPLLNLIANHCYTGYKNRSDKHVAAYKKNKSANQ